MNRCYCCVSRALHACLQSYIGIEFAVKRKFFASWQICLLASLLIGVCAEGALAAENHKATTSGAARRDALSCISADKIDEHYRDRVYQVLNDCSLYRRLPTQMVDCDPKLFTYLAKNPEMLVEIWRKLGITRIELERQTGNSFRMTDNAGTTGSLAVVEQNCDDRAQNRLVMFAEGAYEGKPFNRPIKAQCVLLLRSGSMIETNGRNYVAVQLDSFIRIDRTSIKLLAQALHPLVGKTADRNFSETLQFISSFSQAAETRPETIKRLVSDLPRVSPLSQQKLIQIAYQCRDNQTGKAKSENLGSF